MGRGARTSRAPRALSTMNARALQSSLARINNVIQAQFGVSARQARAIRDSTGRLEILNYYDTITGLTGTAGAPATPGQALAELASRMRVTRIQGVTAPKNYACVTMGLAALNKMDQRFMTAVGNDVLQANLLTLMWDKIAFMWEIGLHRGTYKVWMAMDKSVLVRTGAYLVTAIGTEKSQVQKIAFTRGPDTVVQLMRTINAKTVYPNAPAPSRHPAFRAPRSA